MNTGHESVFQDQNDKISEQIQNSVQSCVLRKNFWQKSRLEYLVEYLIVPDDLSPDADVYADWKLK